MVPLRAASIRKAGGRAAAQRSACLQPSSQGITSDSPSPTPACAFPNCVPPPLLCARQSDAPLQGPALTKASLAVRALEGELARTAAQVDGEGVDRKQGKMTESRAAALGLLDAHVLGEVPALTERLHKRGIRWKKPQGSARAKPKPKAGETGDARAGKPIFAFSKANGLPCRIYCSRKGDRQCAHVRGHARWMARRMT